MTITMQEIKIIFAMHNVSESESDMADVLAQCNEQSGVQYFDIHGHKMPIRHAEDWAHFFALQTYEERRGDWNL